jgi:hypothetical protein
VAQNEDKSDDDDIESTEGGPIGWMFQPERVFLFDPKMPPAETKTNQSKSCPDVMKFLELKTAVFGNALHRKKLRRILNGQICAFAVNLTKFLNVENIDFLMNKEKELTDQSVQFHVMVITG